MLVFFYLSSSNGLVKEFLWPEEANFAIFHTKKKQSLSSHTDGGQRGVYFTVQTPHEGKMKVCAEVWMKTPLNRENVFILDDVTVGFKQQQRNESLIRRDEVWLSLFQIVSNYRNLVLCNSTESHDVSSRWSWSTAAGHIDPQIWLATISFVQLWLVQLWLVQLCSLLW